MSFEGVPPHMPDALEWCRRMARVINSLMQGKTNNTGTVTLTVNAASTVVNLAEGRLGVDTVVYLQPLTANAAAALATTYITTANHDVLNKRFTITHTNNAQVDKSFKYTLVG